MLSIPKQYVALISVHGDPAIDVGKEGAGGQNVYVRNLGEALSQIGWKVDMFTRKVNVKQETIIQHNSNCRTIRLIAGKFDFVPRDDLFDHLPEFIDNFMKFQSENSVLYSLIHTNYWLSGWVGMQLKKIQNCKQIHTHHSLGVVKYCTSDYSPLIASRRLAVEEQIMMMADKVIATSPQESAHMEKFLSNNGNIKVIPCGTDVRKFSGMDRVVARTQLGIANGAKVVIFVGRFDERKGIETLVQAVAASKLRANSDLRLIIIGGCLSSRSDSIEQDRIQSIVEELGISKIATYPGCINQEVLPMYYSSADVAVFPSHYEPFGLVAIEAMACCTPVVASDVGGFQHTVVHEKTGLLASPHDVIGFATAIDRILMNPAWGQKLGEEGRKRVENEFSWEDVAIRISNLYIELLQYVTVRTERALE